MTRVFGLGARLRVRMRTTLENGILRNGQQPGKAVNSFIEHVAVKTLSPRKAPRCDKRHFCGVSETQSKKRSKVARKLL